MLILKHHAYLEPSEDTQIDIALIFCETLAHIASEFEDYEEVDETTEAVTPLFRYIETVLSNTKDTKLIVEYSSLLLALSYYYWGNAYNINVISSYVHTLSEAEKEQILNNIKAYIPDMHDSDFHFDIILDASDFLRKGRI